MFSSVSSVPYASMAHMHSAKRSHGTAMGPHPYDHDPRELKRLRDDAAAVHGSTIDTAGGARTKERRDLLGHDFSVSELAGVQGQMLEHAPLLDDMSMLFLGSAVRLSRKMSPAERENIDVLNPIFQAMLLAHDYARHIHIQENAPVDSSYHRAAQYYRTAIANHRTRCKFIALHASLHWSLLYYDAKTRRWYHYDSIDGYHAGYAASFLAFLASEDIISAREKDDAVAAIYHRPDAPYWNWVPPTQAGGWECGFYALMFVFAIVNNDMRPLDESARPVCDQAYLRRFRGYCVQWLAIITNHINDD